MTMDKTEKPKFVSSYDMESEYEFKGLTYRVRWGAYRHLTSSDYFPTVVKRIGTVMHHDSRKFHEFPDAEVVKLFSEIHEVPFVGAKWSWDLDDIRYDGVQPEHNEYSDGHFVLRAYAERVSLTGPFLDRGL